MFSLHEAHGQLGKPKKILPKRNVNLQICRWLKCQEPVRRATWHILVCPKQLDWQEGNFRKTMINKFKKNTKWIHRCSISTELEIYKSNQMDILEFKNTISEIKNSLHWLHNKMGKVESRINELKVWLIKNIQREKKMEKTEQNIKVT